MRKTNRPISQAQRRALVAVYLTNGGNIATAARETGVTIRTARRWVERFLTEGQRGLQPRSHARKTTRPKKRLNRAIVERVRGIHQKYPALTDQRIAALLTADGVPISRSSVQRFLPQHEHVGTPNGPQIIFPNSRNPLALTRQLEEASYLLDQARWREADALALAASARETVGSEHWAQIVLTYCPLAWQQAGDAARAEQIIAFVEQACREASDNAELAPPIQALIDNRRGWIEDGLRGHFNRAGHLFVSAAGLSQRAGDPQLLQQCRHFRVRVFVEDAMTRSGSWLTARPRRSLPSEIVNLLDRNRTAEGWQDVMRDGNPHHYWVHFNLLALTLPGEAAKLLHDHGSPLAAAPTVHMLSQARWSVSEHQWDRAISDAHDAAEGYCALRHPLGIAHASAIEAHARARKGLRTHDEAAACLDAWITALRLHPFDTHPVYQAGQVGLRHVLLDAAQRDEQWLRAYKVDLPHRMEERDGAFRALDCTDAALGPTPLLIESARTQ